MWSELRKETEKYKEATEEKKLRFEALKKKDESNAKEIAKQMKRLNKLQTSIKEIKARLSSNAKETENRLATIQEERDSVLAHFHELKGEMLKSREKERLIYIQWMYIHVIIVNYASNGLIYRLV